MKAKLEKQLILRLYSLARQGERSVDFALSLQRQWNLLREYYSTDRRRTVHDLLIDLESVTKPSQALPRDRYALITLGWVLSYPVRALLCPWRDSWSFRADEVAFFVRALSSLLQSLSFNEQPPTPTLIDLRMDLHFCQLLIESRLTGVAELQDASRIEHFCQSDYLEFLTFGEIMASAE
jgi:hypothetical protein